MAVLVIGGTGFIGYRLGRLLVARGETVTCMDANPDAHSFADLGTKVTCVRGDVAQFDDVLATMKLEVVVIPVSDVDRAKRFYGGLGWRLDADFVTGDDFRVVQFTPPGSPCSIIFGTGVTSAVPGSAQGLHLVVSDIEAARAELVERGVEVSELFHDAGGVFHHGNYRRTMVRARAPRRCAARARRAH